jgi:cytoskeletal protein RodZ
MPDLSELLKGAVGEVPPFDPRSMVAKQRHRRQVQLVGVAAAVLAIALTLVVWNRTASDNVAISTRSPKSTDASSTTAPASSAASTTLPPGVTTTGFAPPPTAGNGTTTTPGEPSTTLPPSSAPQPGDFTGTLTARPTTVTVGSVGSTVDLSIHNVSGHVVDASSSTQPTTVATICTKLGPDGHSIAPLQSDVNFWFMTNIPMQPGDNDGRTATYFPTAADVGSVTCEGVIATSTDRWQTITVVGRITAIPAVTVIVVAEGTTTTAASAP